MNFYKYLKGPMFYLLIGFSIIALTIMLIAFHFKDMELIMISTLLFWCTFIYLMVHTFVSWQRYKNYRSFHREDK
jgi:hypothetical protein